MNESSDEENKSNRKLTVLYDSGGWFLIYMFFGVAFVGVVLDYLWNLFVLSLTLRWQHINIPVKKRAISCIIITVFGLFIDWLYYELTWGTLVIGSLKIPAVFPDSINHSGLELITILIPMLFIGAVNYFVSRLYLHTENKNSLMTGMIMAVFTAPWLIAAFVLFNW
jgi:hypothetical protein